VTIPKEITEIPWRQPWHPIEPPRPEPRLKEAGRQHVLYERKVVAIGRRYDMDDFVFYLPEGPAVLAVVHVTYSSKVPDPNPQIPWTDLYASVQEFIDQRMIPDADEISQAGANP
jgi:hypothetical protein